LNAVLILTGRPPPSWPAKAGHPRLYVAAGKKGVDGGPSPAMTMELSGQNEFLTGPVADPPWSNCPTPWDDLNFAFSLCLEVLEP
jgi:hypothetical protein